MNYGIRILSLLLCLFIGRFGARIYAPQEENNPANSATKHADEHKTKKPDPNSAVPFHIIVSAQGKAALPANSTIELKGNQDNCRNLALTQSIQLDQVTFPVLPVCKIQLQIFITGFNTQIVAVDLAKYKDPMRILVRAKGTPEVSYGVPAPKVESRQNQPQELASHQ